LRLRVVIEYDGTDFAGWQRQADERSVQGELEAAVRAVTGEASRVVGAGRTDAGVHATGQVAHFDTIWERGEAELSGALCARLPEDVVVRELSVAPPGFHARHSALSRIYAYSILDLPTRSPLARRTSLQLPGPLDAARMAEAAAKFVGTHDFAALGRPMSPGGSTVRRLDRFEVRREGDRIVCEVEANAFLRHQVRRMVGLLVEVGRAHLEVGAVVAVLEQAQGAPVARRLPPQGLRLVGVSYPADEVLRDRPASQGSMMGVEGEGSEDVHAAAG